MSERAGEPATPPPHARSDRAGDPVGRERPSAPSALGGRPPQGISEVILVVRDVARSFAFYRDVVGLAVDNAGNEKFAWLWAGPPGKSQRIGITTGPLSFGAAHVKGPLHFAFGTEDERIDELKAALERHGLEVEGPIAFPFWGARSIYFSDPDGNRVEFCGFGAAQGVGRVHIAAPRG